VDLPEFSRRWGVDLFEAEGAKTPAPPAPPFHGGENSRALRALDVTKSSRTLALERYLREGLMERLADGRIRISRRGLPVSDGILADFV
jgi:hypothetical protein